MRKALGKGIGALIPGAPPRKQAEAPATTTGAPSALVQEVSLDAITVNPRQPRVHFDPQEIEDLAASIRDQGVLQPVLVRSLGGGKFELIAGERRVRAARQAGLERIPALVKEADAGESLVLAIVENVQRADLTPLEEARAYQALIDEFRLTQEEVARRVGKSRPAIANTLRLLQLPEDVQRELEAGRITAGHARALLAVENPAARTALTREIVTRNLSVRDAERAAARTRAATTKPAAPDPDVRRMESDLCRALGTKVTIHPGRDGAGTVQIEYYSNDDLARVVDQLLPRKGGARAAAR